MVSLGGIELSDHLVLDGLEQAPGPVVNQRRLKGGGSWLQYAPRVGGRSLSLVSENHLTLDEVTAIKNLEMAAAPVELVHHRGTFMVLIVDTSSLVQAENHADPRGDEWYSGEIKIVEA